MLCVDDAQWLDVPTLRFLLYVTERVADLPVAILLAAGPDTRGAGADLLAEIACRASTEVVHPAGLTPDAIVGVLGAYLPGDAQRVFAQACHEATDGNPFLIHELAGALSSAGIAPNRANVGEVARLAPESVAEHTFVRLTRQGEAARALAVAVAIAGDGSDLRIAAELAGLDIEVAAEVAHGLAITGVFRAERELSFTHPIVRRAVYAAQTPARLGEAHLRAAELLASADAPAEPLPSTCFARGARRRTGPSTPSVRRLRPRPSAPRPRRRSPTCAVRWRSRR